MLWTELRIWWINSFSILCIKGQSIYIIINIWQQLVKNIQQDIMALTFWDERLYLCFVTDLINITCQNYDYEWLIWKNFATLCYTHSIELTYIVFYISTSAQIAIVAIQISISAIYQPVLVIMAIINTYSILLLILMSGPSSAAWSASRTLNMSCDMKINIKNLNEWTYCQINQPFSSLLISIRATQAYIYYHKYMCSVMIYNCNFINYRNNKLRKWARKPHANLFPYFNTI